MEIIKPILAFKDNYIWAIINEKKQTVWVVDPGSATPVIQFLNENNLNLEGILLTHHHVDHSGGIIVLLQHYGKIPVVGSHLSRLTYISQPVKQDDELDCFQLKTLEIPGHTLDHVAFYNNNVLFCGDTLFSAGCGKIFEGTPTQMYHSLQQILQLPEHTKVYCGHEYTLQNLLFAEQVEPNNQHIKEKIHLVHELLAKGQPTLPSTLKEEKRMNPFLRCTDPHIITAVETHAKQALKNEVDVFAHLRNWKNNYR